jgi:SAM-dependent methyltransferase
MTDSDYFLELDDAAVERFLLTARLAHRAEQSKWTEAGVTDGAVIADVGCGPGAVTVLLGKQVEPGGSAVGVDKDPTALAAARQLARASGAANVRFEEGDAAATGLAPGTFDVVMLRHVLGHNGDRMPDIVGHLRSLLREGGSLYLVDAELTGMRIYPPEPDLQDLYQRYLDFQVSRGNHVSAGLRLAELLRRAGLETADFSGRYELFHQRGFRGPAWEARAAMASAGFANPDDIARWESTFGRLAEAEDFPTLFVPIFVAIGRVPAARPAPPRQ